MDCRHMARAKIEGTIIFRKTKATRRDPVHNLNMLLHSNPQEVCGSLAPFRSAHAANGRNRTRFLLKQAPRSGSPYVKTHQKLHKSKEG